MKQSFWQRLDLVMRGMTPLFLTLALVVLGQIPFHVPAMTEVSPLLPLAAVYHWTVYRPELYPVAGVFFAGLLQDALSGMPFGINAAVFVLVHMVVLTQQVFFANRSFLIIWLGFALVAAGAFAASWLLNALFHSALTAPQAALMQYLVTVGVFPMLAWLMIRWQKSVLAPL
ncbi:MAG: rod shape-determining protein MreD [Alphaproteobacteria bacterium]|nr:rod shape-determining protein MreD [Alphaproteobacteria bacterium]